MKIETLISRIRNAEKNILDTKNHLSKYEQKMIDLKQGTTNSNISCNKRKISKIDNNIKMLKRRIRNYEMQLKQYTLKLKIVREQEKRYEHIPESLSLFMNKWENDTYNFYKLKCEEYKSRYTNEYELNDWCRNQSNCVVILIERVFDKITWTIDYDKLKSIIEVKKKEKIRKFIDKITNVSGDILDALDLKYYPSTNEISGVVKGNKCSVNVSTIISGGYNIQNQHYRIKVDKIDN